ncbi:methyl-accepting chemotaxis domain protein, partial [Vibrio parahaemolyticus V-223/04]|jgi:hypothetical protein
MGE